MTIKNEVNRKALSYFSLVILIVFNGILAGVLIYVGKQVIENTSKSHTLEVSNDVQKEMLK